MRSRYGTDMLSPFAGDDTVRQPGEHNPAACCDLYGYATLIGFIGHADRQPVAAERIERPAHCRLDEAQGLRQSSDGMGSWLHRNTQQYRRLSHVEVGSVRPNRFCQYVLQ